MNVNCIKHALGNVAHVQSQEVIIFETQDALDLMASCDYLYGARSIILHEECISSEFFDLKSGVAGDILQKFSTYQFKLAIVGDFTKYTSKSLRDFIYESNSLGRISFVPTVEMALERLSR